MKKVEKTKNEKELVLDIYTSIPIKYYDFNKFIVNKKKKEDICREKYATKKNISKSCWAGQIDNNLFF